METENAHNPSQLSGFMHGIVIGHFVQLIEMEEKTCTVKVTCKGRQGYLYFDRGCLVDARIGERRGEAAAQEMLKYQSIQVEVLDGSGPAQKTINRSLKHLLLESSRMIDEAGESSEENHLEAAVRLAGQLNIQEALKSLSLHLKANPKSFAGWLWYSRLSRSANKTKAALEAARQIAADNPEVLDEIRKFQSAQDHLLEDRVKRCPFCWCALSLTAVECSHCGCVFAFSFSRVERNTQKLNRAIMRDAVSRFADLAETKENADGFYFSAIAHFNLSRVDESLDLLKKTLKLAPERESVSHQLNALLKDTASRTSSELRVDQHEKDQASEEAQRQPLRKGKILVVEDSPTTRKVIVLTLQQDNYNVIEAKDGLEAMSKLHAENPDLMLLDVMLPKIDGYQLLSLLKDTAGFKTLPVVMLTSKDGVINRVKGKLAGCAAYLTKPFKPEELLRTVERCLPLRR